jgi:hypothetical protein
MGSDTIDLYLQRGDCVYRFKVHTSLTLCDFTRACSIRTANMKLQVWQGKEWQHFYSFRFRTAAEQAMYDKPLASLGIQNGTCLTAEYVSSAVTLVVMGFLLVLTLPLAAMSGGAGSVGCYDVPGGTPRLTGTALISLVEKQACDWDVLPLPAGFPGDVVSLEMLWRRPRS